MANESPSSASPSGASPSGASPSSESPSGDASKRRCYAPATLPVLTRLWETGRLDGAEQLVCHAVTGSLREWYREGDEEELEYAAFARAAKESLALLAPDAPRRVVIALDLDPASALDANSAELGSSEVRLVGPITIDHVACVHIDSVAAGPEIAAAVAALPAARSGDEAAQFVVEEALDHELEWYDFSEIAGLIGPASAG